MEEQRVTVVLANPLSAAQAERLRATEVKDYPKGGVEITLPVAEAASLIDAGYVKDVDPNDRSAVHEALQGNPIVAVAKDTGKDTKAPMGKTDPKLDKV